jgi:DNA-binding transcriptional ArsR family regulator
MSLLPSEPDTSAAEEADPRVIGVDSDDADDVLSALSSETARKLLSELHRDPAPPAEVADRVGTSLQNAQYHIEKLENAGAIEVIDTVYSEKGREMNVYAPADRPLVIFAGDEDQTTGIRAALSRLLGSLGILAAASLVVQAVYGNLLNMGSAPTGGGGDTGGQESGAPASGAAPGGPAGNESTATETATPTPQGDTIAAGTETAESGGGFNIAEATEATETAAPTAVDAGGTSTPMPTETQAATETRAATEAPATEAPATVQEEATRTATEVVNETARNATEAAPQAGDAVVSAFGMEPGLLFFLGGATALCIGAAVWYATS